MTPQITNPPIQAERHLIEQSNPGPATTISSSALGLTHPKPIRILVLEDMLELAALLRENLLLFGFEVETAPDGATALRFLKNQSFDIALVDIDLPDISGFEMVERARATGYLRKTRVIFCTGGYVQERSAQALQIPGSRFMAKPFTIKKLLDTIADAAREQELARD
jgi:DNA-binding response OmpR family regulator